MSSVDERIVKMVFDNSEFSNKIGQTLQSLKQLNQSTEQIAGNTNGLSALGKAFSSCEMVAEKAGLHISNVWLKVANIFEQQVANKIVDTSKKIANAMTLEGMSDGFKEYELKMGSIQTIMAGTGESLKTVNKYLDELNTYSDKTIYSFADMTNNIGKFTNAGVKLEDAVGAIKGIANEAALSGANANEASRAMYNFSQALSAGYVKLIDWKSIENANMATKGFKDALLQVAETVGTVKKGADGMYQVLGKNANGATMKEAISSTKNFNDSLAYQWMTTEVLTKTLRLYATDLTELSAAEKEAFRKDLGLNEEQFKQFEELGHKATLAASEIKTFSMLMDTLKEAIGSGWAMTWQLIVGDFEQAKELWTEVGNILGGVIDQQSQYRNDVLKLWQSVGGRTAIIDAMRNSFEGLRSVLKPISEGFRTVFRQINYRDLVNASEAIRDFTKNLIISGETADKVKNISKGFFSIFDIGLKAVKAFVQALVPAGKHVGSLASGLLDVASNAGEFIYKLDESLTKGKTFEKVFGSIGKVIEPIFDLLSSGASGILDFFSELFAKFKESTNSITVVGDAFERFTTSLSKGVDDLKGKLTGVKPIIEVISSLASAAGKAIVGILKQIASGLTVIGTSSNPLGNLMNMITSFLAGKTLIAVSKSISSFSAVTEIFKGVRETLEDFQRNLQATTLIQIATAIGIMAGSLVIVASIDGNKLIAATAAISTMAFSLSIAMAILVKSMDSFGTANVSNKFTLFGKQIAAFDGVKLLKTAAILNTIGKVLVEMGAAVALMAVGLKVVSSAAEGGHLWDSFAVVSLMLAELTAVAIVLGKFSGDAKKGAKGLVTMTASLVIMAEALKMVSDVVNSGGNWENAVGVISLMLLELTGVSLLIGNFGGKMRGLTGLLSLTVSLNLVVIAIKSISDALGQEGNHILQALGVVSLLIAELTVAAVLMGKFGAFGALGGAGAIAAAGSILVMVLALKAISNELGKENQHVWQALGVIAVALLELAVGLTAMVAALPGAAALLVASAALVVLASSLKILGSMSLGEMIKSIIALGAALAIIATSTTLMIAALPGAAALVVVAAGLTILATALKLLGSMSLWEIIKSLLELTVVVAGIALMGTVLSVTTPFVLAFSAALGAFGLALVAVGAGVLLLGAGLQTLVAILPMGVMAVKTFGEALIGLIPVIVEALGESIGILATKIVEYGPVIKDAAVTLIEIALEALSESVIKAAEVLGEFITNLLLTISEYGPVIADAGYECAISLINGLADAIEKNNPELIKAVDHLMSAALQAMVQWIVQFTPLGFLIPEDLKEGIMSGEVNVKNALGDLIQKAVDAVKSKVSDMKEAGKCLIDGIIQALKDNTLIGKVVSAGASIGAKLVEGFRSKDGIDAHSPAITGIEGSEDYGAGVCEGAENVLPDVKKAGEKIGAALTEGVTNKLIDGAGDASKYISGLTDELDGVTDGLDDVADASSDAADGLNDVKDAANDAADAVHTANYEFDQSTEAVKRSHGKYKLLEDQFNDIINAENDYKSKTKEATKATDENTAATESNSKAKGSSKKETLKQVEAITYGKTVIEAFTKSYGELYKNLGDDAPVKVATLAIKNLAEETYKASLKTKEATDVTKESKASIEDMIKSFTELRTKIYDSVKNVFEGDSFFQKMELKTETTMQSILDNMKSNIDGVASWTTKLKDLANKGVNEGLLKQLAQLGPKGYEYVNAFSKATEEQIREANVRFVEAGALSDLSADMVVASYAKAGLNSVIGFKNGIDENAATAAISAQNLGLTTLKSLEAALEEHSPSRRTYRDGMYLIKGLANGVDENRWEAQISVYVLCTKIKEIFDANLNKDIFVEYGKNIGRGLAEGMSASEVVDAVRAAAEHLSSIAANVTKHYNIIRSPSRLYKGFGEFIAKGFARGMDAGSSYVENSALSMSEIIRTIMEKVATIADEDITIHPVIAPVLDTSALRAKAGLIGSLFPAQSMAMAASIGIGKVQGSSASSSLAQNGAASGTQINFTQNNYSPKELSRMDIYRQTRNQLSMMEGVVKAHA